MSDQQAIVPYILSSSCKEHYPWIEQVIGAKVDGEIHKQQGTDKIMHMRLKLGGQSIYISDDINPAKKPRTEEAQATEEATDAKSNGTADGNGNGKTPIGKPAGSVTCVYLDSQDVDEIYARAQKQGATIVIEVADMFWGQRWCQFIDPWGTQWMVAKALEHQSKGDADQNDAATGKRAAES